MDPRGPPRQPQSPTTPGLVRRALSADSPSFAPAAAAAAVITTRAPMGYPASPPLAPRPQAQPQPAQPPQPTRRVAPPAPTPQPYPQAKPEIVLPAMVPRLTVLLPLHELNIFLQASRRHLAAMEHTGALKGLALRHPRENNNNHNNQQGGGGSGGGSPEKPQGPSPAQSPPPQQQGGPPVGDKQQQQPAANALGTSVTPAPLKVLARFKRGLATLRLADRRVLPYLFLGVHQRLVTGIVTLALRDLNMADEDLIRLGVLLGKPWLLPSLQELYLGGRNRFSDAGLAAFAALGLNPTTASGAAATANPLNNGAIGGTPRVPAPLGQQHQQRKVVDPPALKLHTLDLGGNGLTVSGQALEALAEAFGARSTLLLPAAAPDSDDEGDDEQVKEEAKGGGGSAGKGHGGVVGLRKLVLGQWCWGPRPALLAPSSTPGTEEEAKAATDASPTLHPLRQLLAAPAVAGSLEELDLLQARLLPGEIETLALALHDGAAASHYHRLRVLRLGLDPDAFTAAITQPPPADPIDAAAEANKDGTPPKQQEEQARTAASSTATTTSAATTATPLLPLIACLRDGACPRLITLDLDARLATKGGNGSDNDAGAAAASSAVSLLAGDTLAALTMALRQGQLRRLENVRLARCGLGANDLYLLLEALHAAALAAAASASNKGSGGSGKKKAVGLRGLSVEGNPALGTFGVQVLALCIREGTLPQLQALNLDGARGGDAGLRDLAHAFESLATTSKPLPLSTLSLAGNAITAEGVAWLGRALTSGALPKLAALSLADNPGVGREGSWYLTAFLQQSPPAPCKLKTLDLRWTEMGVEGAEALAALIQAGACPALERLSLAQGPHTPWNPETRAALHKVRDALIARSNPSGFGAGANLTTNPDGTPVSAYVARRRAGAARRRAAAGNGPRVTCI